MADTSYGYPGTIDAAALAKWAPEVGGAQYSVAGVNDWKVIIGTGDRGIKVKAGTGLGDGILDIFNTDTNLNLAAVSSGDRWDLIVCRRTWSSTPGSSTSVFAIIQGSATKGLPSRNNNKGVQADQPIALVRARSGSTAIQEIVDLRVWAHNGGAYAIDELVKTYLDEPGTHLTIGDTAWVRTVTPHATSNSAAWIQTSGTSSFNLFNRGSQSMGNPNKAGSSGFLMQAGQAFVTTDSNAFGHITWPSPFPNGLLTCMLMSADDVLFNDANLVLPGSRAGTAPANKTSVTFNVYGFGGGARHRTWPNEQLRVNWIAIGY